MDPATCQLIETLHQAPDKCVLALTGGGTSAAAQLLEIPGGSRTILEVIVPYGDQALEDFLGQRPEHFCSPETSLLLARRAAARAFWLAPRDPVVGLGATASLASDRPKRGDHRCHVSWCRAGQTATFSLTLTKGARTRAGEEGVLDRIILNALARALGLGEQLDVPLLPGEQLQVTVREAAGPQDFFQGKCARTWITPDGQWLANPPDRAAAVLLPGSFNPLHEGHWGLAKTAERILGRPLAFELSVDNVDKPSLSAAEVRRRLAQFAWRAPVVLTRAPTFVRKAELFPGTVFVVGADTADRIIDPRYYDNESARANALRSIRACAGSFLVAGRADAAGVFHGLEALPVPAEFRDLFSAIAESDFRVDRSSTALRENRHAP